MTTESVFILFKKTDFNTILACLGGKVYRWWVGHKIFVAKIGGRSFIDAVFFCKFGTPVPKKMPAPLDVSYDTDWCSCYWPTVLLFLQLLCMLYFKNHWTNSTPKLILIFECSFDAESKYGDKNLNLAKKRTSRNNNSPLEASLFLYFQKGIYMAYYLWMFTQLSSLRVEPANFLMKIAADTPADTSWGIKAVLFAYNFDVVHSVKIHTILEDEAGSLRSIHINLRVAEQFWIIFDV